MGVESQARLNQTCPEIKFDYADGKLAARKFTLFPKTTNKKEMRSNFVSLLVAQR